MCGIVGVYSVENTVDKESVKRMNEIINHRGPDDEGYFFGKNIGLGMKRLSIIDLKKGKQPIWNEDMTKLIVYNGEVYNYQQIRKELETKGHKFRTKSDTEVILVAYDEWGKDAVIKFNGMFAFAIWDTRKKELFIARDRVGIKPLYYFWDEKKLVFGSEIKSIISYPGIQRELNKRALAEYLTFQNVLDEKTFFKNIKKVMPGHFIIGNAQGIKITQYWNADYTKKDIGFEDALEKYKKVIDSSVKRHMISDVPLGTYLSGGFDSGIVSTVASEKTDEKISTFTGSFNEGQKYTELPAARAVSDKIKANGHEVTISSDDFIPTMPSLMYHLDEPVTGCGAFPQWHVSKLVSQNVKVVLTGHGGDELFAGYQAYKGVWYRQIIKQNPLNIGKLLKGFNFSEASRIAYFLGYPLVQPEVRHGLFVMFSPKELKKLLSSGFQKKLDGFKAENTLINLTKTLKGNNEEIDKTQYLYLKTYLHTLFIIEDKVGMAHSIEARTPLCDNEMIEFANGIPIETKLHNNTLKAIPKEAMKEKLPDILYKQPKKGFPTPITLWFRGKLKKHMYKVLTGKRARQRGIFNIEYVKNLLDKLCSSKTDTLFDYVLANKIYSLYTIELWFRIFIDEKTISKPDKNFFQGSQS